MPGRRAAAWSPWLIVVAGVCVGLPVVVGALSGNLTIPHNDAWSMSRITATFAGTGQIRLLGWNDMNLIGQVVMLGPLGSSLVVQQLAVAVLSVLCLLCAYRLLAVSLTTRNAVLGTVLLGIWPGWASLSTSFETDVPAFAATFAALLLGRRALRRDSAGWLTAALVVSVWAVSIREQAIVAPVAILVYGWLTRRSRQRLGARALCLGTITTAAVLVGFEVWRWGLPLGQNPAPSAGTLRFLGDLVACGSRTYLTLALCLAPAVLVGAARHRWDRRDCSAIGVAVVVVALALLCGGAVGHYLEPSGEYSQVLPGARLVIPHDVWDALVALGCVSGVLLLPVARDRWRSVDPLLGLYTILAGVEIVVIGAAGNAVFDRYLPALLPGTVAVILSHPGRRSMPRPPDRSRLSAARRRVPTGLALRGSAAVALGFIGVISASLAANGFAFDAARWQAAQRLASAGVPPRRIAAGLEWTGWHSPHGMIYRDSRAGQPGGWQLAFYRASACVALSPSPLAPAATTGQATWTPAGSYAYRTFLIVGRSRLYLYRTHAPGCGA
ncbi:MAG: glycosyltransferase family 39 protein [Pseudonocardiaceae bacterium]